MDQTVNGKDEQAFSTGLGTRGDMRSESLEIRKMVTKAEKRMRTAGVIACLAAIVFALPHFWMSVGIPFGFPGDPADLQNGSGPAIFWIVGGFALVAAVYALALTRSFRWMPRSIDSLRWRLPAWLVTLPAWFGGVGFTLWGLGFFGLQLQIAMGLAQPTAQQAHPNAILGYYWYSLFILWGVSLGLAAFYFYKLKKVKNDQK